MKKEMRLVFAARVILGAMLGQASAAVTTEYPGTDADYLGETIQGT